MFGEAGDKPDRSGVLVYCEQTCHCQQQFQLDVAQIIYTQFVISNFFLLSGYNYCTSALIALLVEKAPLLIKLLSSSGKAFLSTSL